MREGYTDSLDVESPNRCVQCHFSRRSPPCSESVGQTISRQSVHYRVCEELYTERFLIVRPGTVDFPATGAQLVVQSSFHLSSALNSPESCSLFGQVAWYYIGITQLLPSKF